MKFKLLPILFAAITVSSFSLNAQDKKSSEMQIKQDQDQFKDRYELQKKTTQNAFNADMKALEEQKNLTPAQRKERMDAIKDRYETQKKANQLAFKKDKDILKEKRELNNNGKHLGEEKHEGEIKKAHTKHPSNHPNNHTMKPDKH